MQTIIEHPYVTASFVSLAIGTLVLKFLNSISGGHCKDCITGYLSNGTPKGEMKKIAGVECYISRPRQELYQGGCIVVSTDVFGHKFINTQLLADKFAQETSSLVVVPDLFDGNAVDPDQLSALSQDLDSDAPIFQKIIRPIHVILQIITVVPWFLRNRQMGKKTKEIKDVITFLNSEEGVKNTVIVGYCYGATNALALASTDLVDALVLAHPSSVKRYMFESVKKPCFLVCAWTDPVFPESLRKQCEEAMASNDIPCQTKVYEGTRHGFAIRGNEKFEHVRQAKKIATEDTIRFFKRYLPKEIPS
eukprot:TRINITY_DN657_c0_g1_i1.p1 TRINITY_DN657_c0_g1~~TRINITY_DN657_c0_g1_i1.p1  ORF type:complete len:306 (-),score=58.95 TRINITY_DN657_c0_g1_i1:19-936(-)